jgi:hypothetical protein
MNILRKIQELTGNVQPQEARRVAQPAAGIIRAIAQRPTFNTVLPQNNELNINPQGFSYGVRLPQPLNSRTLQPSGQMFEDEYVEQTPQPPGYNPQVTLNGGFMQGPMSRRRYR